MIERVKPVIEVMNGVERTLKDLLKDSHQGLHISRGNHQEFLEESLIATQSAITSLLKIRE